MFDEFRKSNPTFQSRIEAFTSGILSPDPKGITLQSMNPLRAYTTIDLYNQVCTFCGFDPILREFPLTQYSMWEYCNGNPSRRYKGSLDSIGAVVKLKVKKRQTPYRTIYAKAYQITDAGEFLGKPLVARGTHVVNEIIKRKPKYSSLWRLLSAASKRPEARYRAGYTRYKIIELLSKNPKDEFRREDIIHELRELDDIVISNTINSLGKTGAIEYYSPHRDVNGKRVRDLSRYTLVKNLDLTEEEIQEIRSKRLYFTDIGLLRSVINYIEKSPNEIFNRNELSKKIRVNPGRISKCLSLLCSCGYLSSTLIGRENRSIEKANEITPILWEEIFEQIGKVSLNLDSNAPAYRDFFDYYSEHKTEWNRAIKTQLNIYNRERSHIGPTGGNELRSLILGILPTKITNPDGMKLSHVIEEVNRRSIRKVGGHAIFSNLIKLKDEGQVEKLKRAHYTTI